MDLKNNFAGDSMFPWQKQKSHESGAKYETIPIQFHLGTSGSP